MFGFGLPEIVVIGVVIFLLFGPNILRGMSNKLSFGIKESQKAIKEIKQAIEEK